jgi:hypothetical protein
MLLAGVILAGTTAYRERGSVDARALGISLVGLAGGTVIGALVLKLAWGPTLPKIFGMLLACTPRSRNETRAASGPRNGCSWPRQTVAPYARSAFPRHSYTRVRHARDHRTAASVDVVKVR